MNIVYKSHYSLKKFNTWHLDGKAEQLVCPQNMSQFIDVVTLQRDKNITCLGLGSNILIRDGGLSGLVCITYPGLSFLNVMAPDVIKVGAGTPCAKVARFCVKHQLAGLEFLVGIPGTIGGALYMNAGAFGAEIWDYVERVVLLNEQGRMQVAYPGDFNIGYRMIQGLKKREYFLSAEFKLKKLQHIDQEDKLKILLKQRAASQPIGLPSCGSVFKNTLGYKAAALIQAVGLKGYCLGTASVSTKHANFIVTEKKAKARHVESLIEFIIARVYAKYGIILKPEVKILGKFK